jgi:hypothetical protein
MKSILKSAIAGMSLLAVTGAMAEPLQLSGEQMDGVTAGSASGLQFNLIAIGDTVATTTIAATTSDIELANVVVQLTSISTTQSLVGAQGGAQSF